MTYPYGVHIAVAQGRSRDRRQSTIERYFIAYDIGRAVNPMLVEGQLAGGFAQGRRRRTAGGIFATTIAASRCR